MKENKAFRRRKILNAAMQVFIQHGYAAADLDDVARLAGVAKGTIYLHFENKACLFERMIDNWIEAHTERLGGSQTAAAYLAKDEYKAAVHRWSRSQDLNALTEVWMLVLSRSFEFPHLLGRLLERAVAPFAASAPLPADRGDKKLALSDTLPTRMQLLSLALLATTSSPAVADAVAELVWISNETGG